MNLYLQKQYLETKAKFDKFSSRLSKNQETGNFYSLSNRKQNFLISRIKKLWEKLRILEIQLKITTVGASLALMLMVSNVSAQNFVSAPDKNPLPPPTIVGTDIFLVDIDADGDLDILSSLEYSQGTNLFKNTGTAALPAFEKVADVNNPFYGFDENIPFNPSMLIGGGDIDNDGDIDLITNYGNIFRNTGTNSDIEYTIDNLNGYSGYKCRMGDIDNDGDLDLFKADYDYNGPKIIIYKNTGDVANFVISDSPLIIDINGWDLDDAYIVGTHAADLDNDGDLDIIATCSSYGYDEYGNYVNEYLTKIVKNTSSTEGLSFTLEDEANNPYSTLNSREFQIGDLDDDGDFDVIAFSYDFGLGYYEVDNDSIAENQDFIPEFYDGILLPANYILSPQFVDYDGDGDLDIFANDYSFNTVHYFEYQETEVQLKYVPIEDKVFSFLEADADLKLPFFIDLDEDGDIDIMRVTYDYYTSQAQYIYLENTGTDELPTYTENPIPAFGNFEDFMMPSFVDIDNDGDIDIFMSGSDPNGGYYSSIVKYYESTGNDPIELTEKKGADNPLESLNSDNYPGFIGYAGVLFSDLDDDGDYDVLFTSSYYGNIHFLENTGTVTEAQFIDRTAWGAFSFISLGYAGSISLADIDGDGDDDLFTHKFYGMHTNFYENTGGKFSVGIQPQFSEELECYPNPVNKELNIEMSNDFLGIMNYEIVSIEGKHVLNGSILKQDNFIKFNVQIESLNTGYYFIRLITEDQVHTSKFMKQ